MYYATQKQTKQEKSKGKEKKKQRAQNTGKKRGSRLPLHAITLDVLPTKQHEHFLRSFNMTGTTGRSVCFVLRRHDSGLELAAVYDPRQICTNSLSQRCTGDLGKIAARAKSSSPTEQPQYPRTVKMWSVCLLVGFVFSMHFISHELCKLTAIAGLPIYQTCTTSK